jgi:hypothetical protein
MHSTTSWKTVIFSHYHENLVAPMFIIWGRGGKVWAGSGDMGINSMYNIAWWNFVEMYVWGMVNKRVPYIKIKQQFITKLNAAHSVETSLFFTVIL